MSAKPTPTALPKLQPSDAHDGDKYILFVMKKVEVAQDDRNVARWRIQAEVEADFAARREDLRLRAG